MEPRTSPSPSRRTGPPCSTASDSTQLIVITSKPGYTNRQINLTLLFGDGRIQEGKTDEVEKMSNKHFKNMEATGGY
ncbi:hypothetical protein TrLO_g3435 [Triparma laevis f. longispina]|uniref:Uncharacterized protein n=1 Tax=Triparma laevis f. longispina TaxID=1714387 RepID=A0A9W7AXA7_9STRA|nr:hypothetical protein TrLO_g3435 [Triparma laevis f. longispina]